MVTFPHNICVKMPFLEISKTSLPCFYGLYYWLFHEYRTRTFSSTKVSQKLALLGSETTCRHLPKFRWKLNKFRWDAQPEDIIGESSSTGFWDQGDHVQLFHTGRTSELDFNVFRSRLLNIGLSWNFTKIRTTPLFFKIDPCLTTSIKSSRRDLLNDMAEHRSILKYYQNTHYSLIFQDRPMFSHINGKPLPIPFDHMSQNRPILKNYQNRHNPRFGFTSTTGENSMGVLFLRVAVISAKNHKRQRRKRQFVTAKREKSQTPKVLTAILTLPDLTLPYLA